MHLPHLVPPLPPGVPGDQGLIGSDSIVWQVARHRLVILGGPAALLLQVAHPLVAAGVTRHSDFQSDPLSRLIATLNATLVTTFGDTEQARSAARLVARRHGPVRGTLSRKQGQFEHGSRYSANNPDLTLWVYATLVEMALDTYSHFVQPLTDADRERYYQESAPFGRLFGVTDGVRPGSYMAFYLYYQEMIQHQLSVGPQAQDIARAIFTSRIAGLPVSPWAQLFASYLLPPSLAADYGLHPKPKVMSTLASFSRTAVRMAPHCSLYWPHYRAAIKRVCSI